jgi:hypothetical protein
VVHRRENRFDLSQVCPLLDYPAAPKKILQRAAAVVGRKVQVELV